MKEFVLITMSVLVLVLAGCGGGQASFESASSVPVVPCNPAVPGSYTSLRSGDVLVEKTAGTKVEIVHIPGGTKKVCVTTGTAVINR